MKDGSLFERLAGEPHQRGGPSHVDAVAASVSRHLTHRALRTPPQQRQRNRPATPP